MPQVLFVLDWLIWFSLILTLACMFGGVIHDTLTRRRRRK